MSGKKPTSKKYHCLLTILTNAFTSGCSLLAPSDDAFLGGSAAPMDGDTPSPSKNNADGGRPAVTPGVDASTTSPALVADASPDAAPADASGCVECEEPPIPVDALALWLRADRGVALDNSGVVTWEDQSDSAAHATQMDPAFRPALVNVDGQPVLQFDGVDDRLALPGGFSSFSGVAMFAVVQAVDRADCLPVLHLSNGDEIDDIDLSRQGGTVHYEIAGRYIEDSPQRWPANARVVLSISHSDSDGVEAFVNGSSLGTDDFSLPGQVTRLQNFVGYSLYRYSEPPGCIAFEGSIGEILLYSRALTDAERKLVESYLQEKWGPS